MSIRLLAAAFAVAAALFAFNVAEVSAHGDVTPQPVDTTGLDPLGEEWRKHNPYRENAKAVEIGTSGYNQNCARCHGLEAISGGLAPDLRLIDKGDAGDEWFMERIRHGAKKPDGTTMMPAFDGLISQEAMWAIRTYLESKYTPQ